MQLVLASSSPRRRELLALLGLSFEVCPSEFHEYLTVGLSPIEQVMRFAREKARSVARVRPQALVLGSDTVIDLDGQLLGKPVDLADAGAMLSRLAGCSHHVHTAVALCDRERNIESVEVATTEVRMKADLEQAYERYLTSEESLGKAGAYAIQGLGGDSGGTNRRRLYDRSGITAEACGATASVRRLSVLVNVEDLYRRKPYANWNRFAA